MTRWEYFIIEGKILLNKDREKFEAELNLLGDQGWEVVAVTEHRQARPTVFLKRERNA